MSGDRTTDAITPLAKALLEPLAEGVLVFNPGGDLVYGNAAGREVVRALNGSDESAEALLPKLARVGARIAPLWVGGSKLGEAVYLTRNDTPAQSTLAERERHAIVETLESTGWRLTESARQLGISRTTLWRRLRAYGLDRDNRARWSRSS